MRRHTPVAEVDANRHSVMPDSERYTIDRYVYDADYAKGESTVTLTMVHRESDERR